MMPVPPSASIRVGLLGGSFNPAHEGHVHISIEALRRLGLNQVWWLVTPQNPLKPSHTMAPLEKRLKKAREITRDIPGILVTDIEAHLGTTYSVHTIAQLQRRFRRVKFVWLMGADNLMQFPLWYRWQEIFRRIPVAIFDRSPFTHKALKGKAAQRFAHRRTGQSRAGMLPETAPPAWGYMHILPHPASSTQLRKHTGWNK